MPRPAPATCWRNPCWIGVGLLLLAFAVYAPVWHAGFIWDDDEFVWNNPVFKAPHSLRQIWAGSGTPDYFPMTYTMLLAEWKAWGSNPLGYHLVNVLLHGVSSIFLWRSLERLKIAGAPLAAAIFAAHPVNVESVAWVAEGKNTLAMFFYSAAVLCWLKFDESRTWRWYGLALGGFALALLSKTAVVTLPFVLLGIAWWRHGRLEWKAVLPVIPFFAVAGALGLVTVWFTRHHVIGTYVIRTDNFWSRLVIAGWAVWFYLYKALIPLHLMVVYPRWHADLANPASYLPLLLLATALGGVWRLNNKGPFFALAYFVVMLLPVLGFLNIAFMRFSLVADHWEYFSIIAPITAVAWAIRGRPWLGGGIVLVLGLLTLIQCRMYQNIQTLWETTMRQDAKSWVAQCELGTLLRQKGQTDEAIDRFEKALKINPSYGKAHMNLAYALLQKGREDQAIAQFQHAVELEPTDPGAANNLAWLLATASDSSLRNGPKAVELAERANSLTGRDKPIILHTLAAAYAAAGRFPEAVATARLGLQLSEAESNTWLAGQFRRELPLYQAGKAFK